MAREIGDVRYALHDDFGTFVIERIETMGHFDTRLDAREYMRETSAERAERDKRPTLPAPVGETGS